VKYLLLAVLLLIGCSKSGSDSKAVVEDPIYGNWIYETPGSGGQRGLVGILDKSGTILLMNYYGYVNSFGVVVIVYRKSQGTFVRNGDSFNVTYTYETCDPVRSETLIMKVSNLDQLLVNAVDFGVIMSLNRAPATTTPLSVAAVEDTRCEVLAKLEKKEKRSIASTKKSKSFFDRVLK